MTGRVFGFFIVKGQDKGEDEFCYEVWGVGESKSTMLASSDYVYLGVESRWWREWW